MDRNTLEQEYARKMQALPKQQADEMRALPIHLAQERSAFLAKCTQEQLDLPGKLEQERQAMLSLLQGERTALQNQIASAQTAAIAATHPVERKFYDREVENLQQKLADLNLAHEGKISDFNRRASAAAADLENRQVEAMRQLDLNQRAAPGLMEKRHQEEAEQLRLACKTDLAIFDCLKSWRILGHVSLEGNTWKLERYIGPRNSAELVKVNIERTSLGVVVGGETVAPLGDEKAIERGVVSCLDEVCKSWEKIIEERHRNPFDSFIWD